MDLVASVALSASSLGGVFGREQRMELGVGVSGHACSGDGAKDGGQEG